MSKKFLFSIIFIFFYTAFFIQGLNILDPDFGWHLKTGELILSKGIPAIDPFSYTMPSFPLIDHEWLADVFIAFFYPKIGNIGLAVIFALFPLGALFLSFAIISKKERFYSFIPLIFTGATFLNVVGGLRPQVISLFFLSVELFLLKKHKNSKLILLLPLLFILWVNLHAGFAIGLFILVIFYFTQVLEKKILPRRILLAVFLSFIAAIINPYGIRIWEEVFRTALSSNLHWNIVEWFPSVFFIRIICFWIFAVASLVFIYYYKQSYSLFQKILYFVLLITAISSVRNIVLFTSGVMDIFTKGIYFLSNLAKKYKYGEERFKNIYVIFVNLSVLIVFIEIFYHFSYLLHKKKTIFYPEKETVYLNKNLPKGNIFSIYDWGGYLIWKLPQKKVFIDGRMPAWKWNKNLPRESKDVFSDYLNLLESKNILRSTIRKYNIDTFLIWQNQKSNINNNKIDNIILSMFKQKILHQKAPEYIDMYKELEYEGFKKVFQGDVGVIYQKI